MTLVSVIIPAYNAEKYIAQTIQSVINQTFHNWEILVVDDGSTDKTAEICKNYQTIDSRIKYIYQNNAKQAEARNNGIRNSNGEILAFLDADDLWLPSKLEKSIDIFDQNRYDLVFTDSYVSDAEFINILGTNHAKMKVADLEYQSNDAIPMFIDKNRIPILTVLVKKSVVEQVGLFDTQCVPAEDFDLWIRLLKNGSVFKSSSEPLSIYRLIENSSSAKDRYSSRAFIKTLMKNFSPQELKNMNVDIHIKKWIKRWINVNLNKSNGHELKTIILNLNQNNSAISRIFVFRPFLRFSYFKRLILKKLEQ